MNLQRSTRLQACSRLADPQQRVRSVAPDAYHASRLACSGLCVRCNVGRFPMRMAVNSISLQRPVLLRC